jgi:hypothetical protein
VSEQTISVSRISGRGRGVATGSPRRLGNPIAQRPWLAVALALVVVSAGFVVWTGMRPAYDAYGWLVWGRQAAHLDLDTSAAPSWKPLTFLFTFPYALLTGRGALWLWMVSAVAGALAGAPLAARIAYRLAGPSERRFAPIAAAAFAGLGVLGIEGYWHLILIATADALVVSLCLGAIDRHLSGRPRVAWVLLVLASLGRPEAWPLAGLYGLWAWRKVPSMRAPVAAGLAVIPALWFGIAALTSPSWLIAGDVALGSTIVPPGSGISRVISGFLSLYELPMQLAVLFALVLAVARRERTWLLLAAAALVWVLAEMAFALHGWSGNSRYLFAPAAVLIVLAGAAIGRVLGSPPGGRTPVGNSPGANSPGGKSRSPRRWLLMRWAAPVAVVALVVALVPHARIRARLAHNGILLGRTWARQINRLHAVIAKEGGPKRILACGQAVTEVSYQSILAWEMGKNVSEIGWDPNAWIKQGQPLVLFEPVAVGWKVRLIHIPATNRANCDRLQTDTAFN